jgi:hypothetical protein
MNERFDVQGVLRDVLDVLRRHHIPVETASLNISLRDAAFDDLIPQLQNYKAGNLYRPLVIDGVPMLFRAQRRYLFDEVAQALESSFRLPVEAFAEALRQDYPDLSIEIISKRTALRPEQPNTQDSRAYHLGIHCQFSADAHLDFNQLDLLILLLQIDAATYPHLQAWVGWLIDEESGGDWGLDIVYDAIGGIGDYSPHHLDLLRQALPIYFERFRSEVARKRTEDAANPATRPFGTEP